jgi:Mn-dependent DtxR family transcriptional regulator
MELTTINSARHRGVFVDNKKVQNRYIDYLRTISELSQTVEQVNSRNITDALGRTRSAVETLKTLETLGYIYDSEDGRTVERWKNWKLTSLGTSILELSQK